MTPEDAAALLQVGLDSSVADIDRAWRHQARRWHPDLQGAQSAAGRASSAEEFVRVSEARKVLLELARQRGIHQPPGARSGSGPTGQGRGVGAAETVFMPTSSSIYGNDGAKPWPNEWLFWTWTGVLVLACVVSFIGGMQPHPVLDLLLRLLPLVIFSTSFALTGRRSLFRGMLLFVAISAVFTVVFASFGSLFSLLIVLVPVIGLGVLGMRMARLREAALRSLG